METEQQTDKAARQGKSASSGRSKKMTAEAEKKQGGKKRFEIDIFSGWCKSCGICAAFCPRECIQMDEEGAPTKINSDRCTGCGWCELHCPDFAISVHEKDDKIPSQDS